MKFIKLNIPRNVDRTNLVQSLANNGIPVWVETEENCTMMGTNKTEYYVCFEVNEKQIIDEVCE